MGWLNCLVPSCFLPQRNSENNNYSSRQRRSDPVNLVREPKLIMLPKDPRVLRQSMETDYFCRDHSRGFNESMHGGMSSTRTFKSSRLDSRNKNFEENAKNPYRDPKIPGFGIKADDNFDSNTIWKQEKQDHIGMRKRKQNIFFRIFDLV